MPELPEVETVARDLRRAGLEGRRIVGVLVGWPKTVAGLSPDEFAGRLTDAVIRRITRRAKFLVLELGDTHTLLVHLRMTGRFELSREFQRRGAHEHVVLLLDNGVSVHYTDPRKFGRWILTNTPEHTLGRLGPEPLSRAFTAPMFRARLRLHRRQIKPLLLDQSFVAGLGNIYVDEALWEARIHPCRRSDTLEPADAERLHLAIQTVLRLGIRHQGTTLGAASTNFYSAGGRRGRNQDALNVFRRTGDPCPRCGDSIVRLVVGQRGTHVCLRCQPQR
jgi:formamidopyrimidine-DNA glycosylase